LKKKTTTYDGGPPVDKLVAAQALPEPLFSTNDHRRRLKAAASPLPGGVSKTTGFTGGRLSLPSRRSPGCCASRFPLRLLSLYMRKYARMIFSASLFLPRAACGLTGE
jgi:hypothetical protein